MHVFEQKQQTLEKETRQMMSLSWTNQFKTYSQIVCLECLLHNCFIATTYYSARENHLSPISERNLSALLNTKHLKKKRISSLSEQSAPVLHQRKRNQWSVKMTGSWALPGQKGTVRDDCKWASSSVMVKGKSSLSEQ